MPCKQVAPTGDKRPPFRTGYATEADCLNACREGACCEGTTCTVKPQCQCHGTGKVFRGVGTVCGTGIDFCDPCPTGLCCGPDTTTIRAGESGPTGRNNFTRAQCNAIGGVYTPCASVQSDEKTGLYTCANPLP